MRSHSGSIKRVKSEIEAVGKEINYRIERLEKLPKEMDDNCEALKTFVDDQYDILNTEFRKAYMVRGEDVWEYVWDHIWDMVREFQRQAAAVNRYSYPELESELKSCRTRLGRRLQLNDMWADQVWTEIWASVRQTIQHQNDEYRHQAMAEFERCAAELDPLLDKKVALKKELEQERGAEGVLYKALKSTFSTKGKGRP